MFFGKVGNRVNQKVCERDIWYLGWKVILQRMHSANDVSFLLPDPVISNVFCEFGTLKVIFLNVRESVGLPNLPP